MIGDERLPPYASFIDERKLLIFRFCITLGGMFRLSRSGTRCQIGIAKVTAFNTSRHHFHARNRFAIYRTRLYQNLASQNKQLRSRTQRQPTIIDRFSLSMELKR